MMNGDDDSLPIADLSDIDTDILGRSTTASLATNQERLTTGKPATWKTRPLCG